jgi:hypothetical protein
MSTRTELLSVVAAIDTEIAQAEQELETLRLQRIGAEALLRRMGLSAEPNPNTPSRSSPTELTSPSSGNAEFVASLLAGNAEGLTLAAIEGLAAEHGKPLNNDQVRSAVTYLKRRGQAERLGRGLWRLVGAEARSDSDGTVPISELHISGAEGTEEESAEDGGSRDHAGASPALANAPF